MINPNDVMYKNKYTSKSLRSFLKKAKLPFSGTNQEKIERINKEISNGTIMTTIIENWHSDLVYEGNKHVYIYSHRNNITEFVEDYVKLISERNKDIHYYEKTDDKITIILKEPKYNTIYDNDTGEYKYGTEVAYFIIVEILPTTMLIHLDPPTNLVDAAPTSQGNDISVIEDIGITSKRIAQDYKNLMVSVFKLNIVNNSMEYIDVLNHLSKSVNDTISESLQPYTDKINEETIAYIEACLEKLSIKKDILYSLAEDLNALWQYIILEKSSEKIVFNDKYGKIVKESFKTLNGSSVRVASRSNPVYTEKLHYNIKGTVQNTRTCGCTSLKFRWKSLEENEEEIATTLECYNEYFSIVFLRDYNKEEIDYVLSTIEQIKSTVQCSTGDS